MQEGDASVLDKFPRLRAIVAAVETRPRVKGWLSKRTQREQELGNYIDWLL